LHTRQPDEHASERRRRLGIQDVTKSAATLREIVEDVEEQIVRQDLQRHDWNQSGASRELGLSRVGIANKVQRFGIERDAAADLVA
jgi:two-component system response regulator HupR/HoxA